MSSANCAIAFDPLLGTSFSPAHLPDFKEKDRLAFFRLAKQLGSHVTFISEWKDQTPIEFIVAIMKESRMNGLKFHLYLSPLVLSSARNLPAIPASVRGSSFTEPAVRKAFIRSALEFASIKPDILGLGTEVNFLAANATEYDAYRSLAAEAYREIKRRYPQQVVTLSFQWDLMITQKAFKPLADFRSALDFYSFTSYPSVFKNPENLPPEYYSCLRKLLPGEPLGFSEIGWSTADTSQKTQAQFLKRLPSLMKDARPQYITLALLHDVRIFSGNLSSLNSCGVCNWDGSPKEAWTVLKRLVFM